MWRTALVNVVNFSLDQNNAVKIQSVAGKPKLDEQERELVQGFVLEALRQYLWRYSSSLNYSCLGSRFGSDVQRSIS